MFRAPPVVSTYLDIAEKTRSYEKHLNALNSKPRKPLAVLSDIAPSVKVFETRKFKERKMIMEATNKRKNGIMGLSKSGLSENITLNVKKGQKCGGNNWSAKLSECMKKINALNNESVEIVSDQNVPTFVTRTEKIYNRKDDTVNNQNTSLVPNNHEINVNANHVSFDTVASLQSQHSERKDE